MICPQCGKPLAIDTELGEFDGDAKSQAYASHLLWSHPTPEQMSKLLVDLYLHTQSVIASIVKEDFIKATIVAQDLDVLVLRAKKYADIQLGDT